MYQRNEKAEMLCTTGIHYEHGNEVGFNNWYVSNEELKRYAELFSDDFLYKDNALYSADMKIAYAYAVDGGRVWDMPDSVEIYDSIFSSPEFAPFSLEEVHIGKKLREIIGIEGCFGMSLKKIDVDEDNQYFTSVEGCLYSKNKKELICYPPKYTRESFAMYEGTEIVKKNAVLVELLPDKFVIPDSVQVLEEDWLWEMYDKGCDMTREQILEQTTIEAPKHLEKDIEAIWEEYEYGRPTIVYR